MRKGSVHFPIGGLEVWWNRHRMRVHVVLKEKLWGNQLPRNTIGQYIVFTWNMCSSEFNVIVKAQKNQWTD